MYENFYVMQQQAPWIGVLLGTLFLATVGFVANLLVTLGVVAAYGPIAMVAAPRVRSRRQLQPTQNNWFFDQWARVELE